MADYVGIKFLNLSFARLYKCSSRYKPCLDMESCGDRSYLLRASDETNGKTSCWETVATAHLRFQHPSGVSLVQYLSN